MALSIDTVTSGVTAGSGSTLTFAHTCAAGSVLFVGAGCSQANTITGVTYNTVAMTLAVATAVRTGTAIGYVSIWYIKTPASGANNVVITASATTNGVEGGAISFLGADTTNPLGATTVNDPGVTSTTISKLINSTVANSYILDCLWQNGNGAQTNTPTGTNQNKQWDVAEITLNGEHNAGSTILTTSIGPYTMSWSSNPTEIMSQAIVEVLPLAGAVITTKFLTLLGAG